jgi:hypothetical protein
MPECAGATLPMMLTMERVALELLEYKVDALVARRDVRGGVADMWQLHDAISRGQSALTTNERERFVEVARRLRAVADMPTRGTAARASLFALTLDGGGEDDSTLAAEEPPAQRDRDVPPEIRAEQSVLQRLAERVWWEELDDLVLRLAASWRAERDRVTPRLVYATLRNLHRYAEDPAFASDANLRTFKVRQPLPEREDPLISLSDVDSLAELARELIDLVMTLGHGGGAFPQLEIPESGALPYVRQALHSVARDPWAGKLSPIVRRGASSSELRTALEVLARERLPEHQKAVQRADLERRLAETLAFERHQRDSFQRDVQRAVGAASALAERLQRHLPERVGGRASGPRLSGGVIGGLNPALRWEKVPAGAQAVTLRVTTPVRFTIGGHQIAVVGSGASRTLFADETPFELESHMDVKVERGRLLVDVEGDYVHLRYRDEGHSLAKRMAEGLVVFFVLSHEEHERLLTVMQSLASLPSGAPDEVVRQAVARIGQVTARAPQRRDAVEGLLRGAVKATDLELDDNVVLALADRVMTALTVEPVDLAGLLARESDGESAVYQLTGEPVTVTFKKVKLTIRQYRGRKETQDQLVVVLPGHVIGSIDDVLVEPVAGGTLICARGEGEVAVLYLPERSVVTLLPT